MHRRHFLAITTLPLLGCAPAPAITGDFTGIAVERGHLLRKART